MENQAAKFYSAVEALKTRVPDGNLRAANSDENPPVADAVGHKNHPAKATPGKYAQLFECKENVVTLKIQPKPSPDRIAEAVLMIILGYKECLNSEEVIVHKLLQSTQKSGLTGFERIIHVMEPLLKDGLAFKRGAKRGTRYSLTATGTAKAEKIIKDLISHVSEVKSS